MELRHFRYFCAVTDAGSFTAAARRVHVTQSTLSHQIRQLEGEIGAALFDRDGRRVRLTEAGVTLEPFARRCLQEAESGRRAVGELLGLERGALRIGAVRLFNNTVLVPALAAFAREHPGIQILTDELTGDEIEARVAEGSLDIGFGFLRAHANRAIAAEPLYDEPYAVIASGRHRLARRRSIELADLAGERLGMLTREFVTRRIVDEHLARGRIEANIVFEANSIETVLQMVDLGDIATVMPESAHAYRPKLKMVRIRAPVLRRRIALLWPRRGYRSVAARALAVAIKDAVASRVSRA